MGSLNVRGLIEDIAWLRQASARVGLPRVIRLRALRAAQRGLWKLGRPSLPPVWVHVPQMKYPFRVRPGSSDEFVLHAIFVEGEYDPLAHIEPAVIVDCGANVGYSSIFFLNKFPNARIVALEPEAKNLELCRANLQPYGERVDVLPAAIWSHETGLAVLDFGNGVEWGARVRECEPGEAGAVAAIDMTTLMRRHGIEQVDLLKIDIEHAEIDLFSRIRRAGSRA